MQQSTLRIKEASHPEKVRSSDKHPVMELVISLQQLCKPEAQCRGLPGNFPPQIGNFGIKHVIQGITQVLQKQSLYIITDFNIIYS